MTKKVRRVKTVLRSIAAYPIAKQHLSDVGLPFFYVTSVKKHRNKIRQTSRIFYHQLSPAFVFHFLYPVPDPKLVESDRNILPAAGTGATGTIYSELGRSSTGIPARVRVGVVKTRAAEATNFKRL